MYAGAPCATPNAPAFPNSATASIVPTLKLKRPMMVVRVVKTIGVPVVAMAWMIASWLATTARVAVDAQGVDAVAHPDADDEGGHDVREHRHRHVEARH